MVALGAGLNDAAKPVAVQPVSLKSALDAKMNKALDLCWALLLELGPSCPRFAKLSTVGEARPAMEAVQRDVFRAKFTTPDYARAPQHTIGALISWVFAFGGFDTFFNGFSDFFMECARNPQTAFFRNGFRA